MSPWPRGLPVHARCELKRSAEAAVSVASVPEPVDTQQNQTYTKHPRRTRPLLLPDLSTAPGTSEQSRAAYTSPDVRRQARFVIRDRAVALRQATVCSPTELQTGHRSARPAL